MSNLMRTLFVKKSFSTIQSALIAIVALLLGHWATAAMQQPLRAPESVTLAEKRVAPDNIYKADYEFTTNWFNEHADTWIKALAPFAGKPGVEYLEVGLFEGGSAFWILENVLTHPTSHLTGIDPFDDSNSFEKQFPSYPKRFFSNLEISGMKDRTTIIRGFSQIELRKLPQNHFDIIYIDGSHHFRDVLEDSILATRLLKDGGIIIFDDYSYIASVKRAVNVFYDAYADNLDVLHNGFQLILRSRINSQVTQ